LQDILWTLTGVRPFVALALPVPGPSVQKPPEVIVPVVEDPPPFGLFEKPGPVSDPAVQEGMDKTGWITLPQGGFGDVLIGVVREVSVRNIVGAPPPETVEMPDHLGNGNPQEPGGLARLGVLLQAVMAFNPHSAGPPCSGIVAIDQERSGFSYARSFANGPIIFGNTPGSGRPAGLTFGFKVR
jgi:hypothetical protein